MWWTWHHVVCPPALPVPPVTLTETTPFAEAPCGQCAQWSVLKVSCVTFSIFTTDHIDFIVCYSCGLFYLTRWWEHNGTHTNTPHAAATPGCFPTMHMCCRAAHCAPDGRWRSSGRWSCRWEAMKNLLTNHLINIFTHCSFRASH